MSHAAGPRVRARAKAERSTGRRKRSSAARHLHERERRGAEAEQMHAQEGQMKCTRDGSATPQRTHAPVNSKICSAAQPGPRSSQPDAPGSARTYVRPWDTHDVRWLTSQSPTAAPPRADALPRSPARAPKNGAPMRTILSRSPNFLATPPCASCGRTWPDYEYCVVSRSG